MAETASGFDRRACCVLGDKEEGASLDFVVHPPEVLPDDSQAEELYASEDQHGSATDVQPATAWSVRSRTAIT
jgi:hypothetical protein